jgi:hypothetical protein
LRTLDSGDTVRRTQLLPNSYDSLTNFDPNQTKTFPIMKTQRFAIGLTVLNLFVIMSVLFRANSATTPELPSVLRVRGLELVDDQGRVRAMLKVMPADPNVKMPDGTTGYPETVLFRLIDSRGAPNVKITATEDGSAMSISGGSNPTYVQVLARGTNTSLTLVNQDGQKQVIKP